MIKGVAVLLMMIHHLWGFPDRIAGGGLKFTIPAIPIGLIPTIGMFGGICVSVFFFLSGYGLYHSFYGKSFDPISRLKGLYVSYWKVFVIFIPIGFLLFSDQPAYCEDAAIYTAFNDSSWMNCIQNFFGITVSINREWWFLKSYVIAFLSFPLFRSVAERFSLKVNLLLIVTGSILVTSVFPAIGTIESIGWLNDNTLYSWFFCQSAPFIACFWMGIVTAKDRVLERLSENLKAADLLNPVVDILGCGVIFFLRQCCDLDDNWDIIYLPFLTVFCIDIFRRTKIISQVFLHMGKQSTNIWLIHSFFCYYYYPIVKAVTVTRDAVLSLIILCVISYASSVAVTYIWKVLGLLLSCLKGKKSSSF